MKWKISTLQNGNLLLFAKGTWLKKITHHFDSSPCSNVANCSCSSFCFTFCTYGVKVFFFSKSVLQGPKSWHEIFVSLSILTLTPDLMFNCSCSWPVPKYRLFCSLHLFGPCIFPFLRKSIILFRFAMHYTQDFSSVKELRPIEGFQAIQEMKVSQMILTRQSVRKLPTKVLYQVTCRGAVASLFARVGGRERKC